MSCYCGIKPLVLKVTTEQCVFRPDLLLFCGVLLDLLFLFWNFVFTICELLGVFILLFRLKYSLWYFCRTGFVAIDSFNLFLSWKVFLSPLILVHSVAGCNSLGSQLSSSFQAPLALNIAVKDSDVILMGLPL